MRYAQGSGLTPAEQAKRRLRLASAERFKNGERPAAVARVLRVMERSVRRWRHAWEARGEEALLSVGLVSAERLSTEHFARLERELACGPLAHGWAEESQGWTLKRIKLLIGRMFHVGYTVLGVWKLRSPALSSASRGARHPVAASGPPRRSWSPILQPPTLTTAQASATSSRQHRVLRILATEPGRVWHGRELARLLDITNLNSFCVQLSQWASEGIIRKAGRALYSLTDPRAMPLISCIQLWL